MDTSAKPSQLQPVVERKSNGQNLSSCGPSLASLAIDTDLSHLLQGLKGGLERKLEKIGKIIYSYGAERFGVKSKNTSIQKDQLSTSSPGDNKRLSNLWEEGQGKDRN